MKWFAGVGFLLLMAVLVSCGGGSDEKPVDVGITLREWEVEAQPEEVHPGLVRFNVTNSGAMEHQFMVVKSDLPPNQLPTTGDSKVDESKVNISGAISRIAPGESARLELDLFPGKYLLLSNGGSGTDSHYLNGMVVSFLVLDR